MMRNEIIGFFQNKNTIMFITTIFFMLGILSYFNNCSLISAGIITVITIYTLFKKYVSYKYILFWVLIFYLGFFNSYFRIKTTDALLEISPQKGTITGQIVSIPNSNTQDKIKFFFKVNEFNNEKISGKTLVTLSSDEGDFSSLNIGDRYKITGKLRTPFRATNPSQFDYSKYLEIFLFIQLFMQTLKTVRK